MGAKSASKVNIKKTKKTNYLQSWRRKSQWRKNWKVNKLKRPFAVIMQGLCRKMRKSNKYRGGGSFIYSGQIDVSWVIFLTYTTHLPCGITQIIGINGGAGEEANLKTYNFWPRHLAFTWDARNWGTHQSR